MHLKFNENNKSEEKNISMPKRKKKNETESKQRLNQESNSLVKVLKNESNGFPWIFAFRRMIRDKATV